MDNVRCNRPSITQDYLPQNNVEVKDLATIPPDMPPAEQVLHILGQHDMVWCRILAQKNSPGSCYGASGGKGADFSAPNSAYCWSDKELSVGCGALQADIAIQEMMLMQEKQYDMPQHLVFSTDLLS